jgi:hypothetical protein
MLAPAVKAAGYMSVLEPEDIGPMYAIDWSSLPVEVISKEELVRRMRRAVRVAKFTPPVLEEWEAQQ